MKETIKNICTYCKKEFETKYKMQKCCSLSCSAKLKWTNIEFKKQMSDNTKEYQNKPEVREAHSKFQKEYQNRPDIKEKKSNSKKEFWSKDGIKEDISEKMKNGWNKPGVKEKVSEHSKKFMNRPEIKNFFNNIRNEYWSHKENIEKASIIQKIVQNKPDVKKTKSNSLKKYTNNTNVRENISKRLIEKWKDPEYKKRTSKNIKAATNKPEILQKKIDMWKDPVYADMMMKSLFKYKDYLMPSGKVVKLQGYEPQVLTELLNNYSEDDIVIGIKNINKEIGQIKYVFDGFEHSYYPDFYIKSENKIIEVKIIYTYNQHKEKNELKRKACLDAGFNFEFKIYK